MKTTTPLVTFVVMKPVITSEFLFLDIHNNCLFKFVFAALRVRQVMIDGIHVHDYDEHSKENGY